MSTLSKITRLLGHLFALARRDLGSVRHVLGNALQAAEDVKDPVADVRFLPVVDPQELCPGETVRIANQIYPGASAAVSATEACALALLARRVRARKVFEFGTYKGVSTTQLALNLEPTGQIWTLDLPDDGANTALDMPKPEERAIAAEGGKGSLIPPELLGAIQFVRQDSATFDEAPHAGTMDLVFVDGAHSYPYVRNDSEKGWRMLRPGGVLAWHDCMPNHPDVVRFVRECGWGARRIGGTTLAFAQKP